MPVVSAPSPRRHKSAILIVAEEVAVDRVRQRGRLHIDKGKLRPPALHRLHLDFDPQGGPNSDRFHGVDSFQVVLLDGIELTENLMPCTRLGKHHRSCAPSSAGEWRGNPFLSVPKTNSFIGASYPPIPPL